MTLPFYGESASGANTPVPLFNHDYPVIVIKSAKNNKKATVLVNIRLVCGWRDSHSQDYPLQLVDMRQRVESVLNYIYADITPNLQKIGKKERDAKIYTLHLQGVSNHDLAKQFKLSEHHIERVIRDANQGRAQNI